MLFDSEKGLLFDINLFWGQECSFTYWSHNHLIAWFYAICVFFGGVYCIARKYLPKLNFASIYLTYVVKLNPDKWHMVKKRLSSLTFFCNWREHFVFHVAITNKATNSYTIYNLQKRSNVWKSTHWLDFSVWNILGTKSMTQSIDSRG